jgi:hypothetical protein
MNLAKKIIVLDKPFMRLDMSSAVAHTALVVGALLWSLIRGEELVLSALVSLAFSYIAFLALRLMGASRLSSVGVSLLLLAICYQVGLASLAQIGVFGVIVLLCTQYFKYPTKFFSILLGVIGGLLAAGMGANGYLALLVLFLAVSTRLVWHLAVERLGKKQLILLVAKTILVFSIAAGAFLIFDRYISFDWPVDSHTRAPAVNGVLAAVVGLLVLRGLWANLLLKTKRSPMHRGIRLYFLALALLIVGLVTLFEAAGTHVFAHGFFERVEALGLTTYSVELLVFVVYAVALLVADGIDRSLFEETAWSRRLRSKLSL